MGGTARDVAYLGMVLGALLLFRANVLLKYDTNRGRSHFRA
jgi:hypothetical protein